MKLKILLLTFVLSLNSVATADSKDNKFQLQTTGADAAAYLLNTQTGEVWFISPVQGPSVTPHYKANDVRKYKVKSVFIDPYSGELHFE